MAVLYLCARRCMHYPLATLQVVFTDHLTMPKKTDRFLSRLGAKPISVGPKMLLATQCIVLVHNELDRQGIP